MNKKFKYDGKSRPVTDLYKKNFDRIFGNNSKDSENDDTLKTSLTNKKDTNENKN